MRRLFPTNIGAGLLLIRVGLAIIFLYHGIPKILDLPGTLQKFEGMEIPIPALTATIATIVEAPAGLAMLLGVGVEIAGPVGQIAVDTVLCPLNVHRAP